MLSSQIFCASLHFQGLQKRPSASQEVRLLACKGYKGYNGGLQPETLADRQLVKQAQPASS